MSDDEFTPEQKAAAKVIINRFLDDIYGLSRPVERYLAHGDLSLTEARDLMRRQLATVEID